MEELKAKFNRLLMSTGRRGMNDLINHLTINGFYKAPCSASFHLSCEGGLLLHSISVYEIANKIYQALELQIPYDSVVLTSLLHDCGKLGNWGKPLYEPNYLKSGEISTAKPYVCNSELQFGVLHELASIQIVEKFIELTEDEHNSILGHNGLYGVFKNQISGKETPLYLLTHTADMFSSRFYETKEGLI
jgi:23S rRNA maturation-related 3'-5' exoribonuclease YhaM